jgi:hypothetical protein
MIGNYPLKPSSINMKNTIMKNVWKKKKVKELKSKSIRSNLVTRVTVPASTTSIKSIKYFRPDDHHSSLTPADLRMPSSKCKSKGSPAFKYKPRETGARSELSDRKDPPNFLKMYNQGIHKSGFPHQSIDDIKSMNKQMKLIKKNKTIEEMLLTNTPSMNYKSNYPVEKANSKIFRKYCNTIMTNNHSKRSVKSGSKSRSSCKDSKELNRLMTKSKLRLSGKISAKTTEIRAHQLEESNMLLTRENEMLLKENMTLKEKLSLFSNYVKDFSISNIQHMFDQLPKLAENVEFLEETLSTTIQGMIKERQTCKKVYDEYTLLTREKEKDIMSAEMNKNYLETKNSLLKEVLTKRNKDMDEIEKGNKQLMAILEKYDAKMDKMREQIEVQRLKIEKYEEMDSGKIKKIDIDTIDGRINFLVDILEDYKKQLEEMEDEEEEEEDEVEDVDINEVNEEDEELDKLRDILGSQTESVRLSEQEIPLDNSVNLL